MPLNDRQRERFDSLFEEALGCLPERISELLDEVPVILEDQPSVELLAQLAAEWGEDPADLHPADLCGLHSGRMLTERSVDDHADLPEDIHLFRVGIIETAGGWDQDDADDLIYEEIMVTLLHEIGHHFGLDEDDLAELGYE